MLVVVVTWGAAGAADGVDKIDNAGVDELDAGGNGRSMPMLRVTLLATLLAMLLARPWARLWATLWATLWAKLWLTLGPTLG